MTPEQKQSELQRHRVLLLATLDYLEERLGGSIVFDQDDIVTEYYQQQKVQTEKYFKLRRLDRMQQRLASLIAGLQSRTDLEFTLYVKQKTGYDLDIFEDLQKRVDVIVAQKEIRSENELSDAHAMLRYYDVTAADSKKIEQLDSLLTDYSRRISETKPKKRRDYSEVISRVEKDGLVTETVRISTGPRPQHFKEQYEVSPDGKRSLRVVQWDSGGNASTYVTVGFPTASGGVFAMSGIHDVKASWKDNSTIVIEVPKGHTAHLQHKQVRSFEDIIAIEYISFHPVSPVV